MSGRKRIHGMRAAFASRSSDRSGSALITVMLLLLAMSVLGATAMMYSITNLQIADNQRHGTAALFAAEAGISEAVHRLSLRNPTMITVDGNTFNAAIADDGFPPDPNYTARIFLAAPGSVPAPTDSSAIHTASIQSATDRIDYGSDSDPNEAITVQHKWVDVNGNNIREVGELVFYDGRKNPPENFLTGVPIEVISVTGRDGTGNRRVEAEVTRLPLTPNVIGAISSDNGVDISGNVSICGHNHRIDTPPYTQIAACDGWRLLSGDLFGVITTGDPVVTGGSSDLQGDPSVIDTASTNPFYSLAEVLGISPSELADILLNADHNSANDGSPLEGVTYVPGDATGSEKFNSVTGNGLVYVNGDMDISGGFVWRGLIYVEGDMRITGTAWILGGVVVKGSSTYSFAGGAPAILYSGDAIHFYLTRYLPYVRLAWREM